MAVDEAYRRAEQRIERARQDGAAKLDLSSIGLTEIPEAIGQLSNLQELNLYKNKISSLPEVIGQLTSLQRLDLGENQISSLPEAIGQLTSLQRLDLSNNSISSLPESLGQLRQLQKLFLNNNLLSSLPESLGQLTRLQLLNVFGNKISSLPESLGQLRQLQLLEISFNLISSLPESFGQLNKLQRLYLSGNKISSLPEMPGQLRQLKQLKLNNNQISSLPETIGQLNKLQQLYLDNNPLNSELAAAYAQGTEVVLQYLRSRADSQIKLNEAKLILVGEGEVGKTSLLGALRGDPWVENRLTTHGVEIKPAIVKDPDSDTEITLNAWDFGGQPVYRPTHQFFFSAPAVYLVVWKPREGPQQAFIEYWLNLIKRRAPEAKIIIVSTHGGPNQRQPDIDSYDITTRFGSDTICKFVRVDSKPDANGNLSGIHELKDAIARIAANLPGVGDKVPAKWQQVRADLQATEKAYLSYDKVIELCADRSMNQSEADLFLLLSHTLGHLIHYHHDTLLQDTVILKPDWLAKAISFVLDDRVTRENKGLVEFSRLKQLWNDPGREETERYPLELHAKFRRLMERFDISYRIFCEGERSDTSLIAQLVTDDRPNESLLSNWGAAPKTGHQENQRICRIVDDSGNGADAEGLFYRLIARLHKYSLGRENYQDSVHWKRGLVLDDNYNGMALLEHVGTDVRITVRAADTENLLDKLIAEVQWLVKDFWEGLQCQVMVPCVAPCGKNHPGKKKFEVETLVAYASEGMPKIFCDVPGCKQWQNIEQLLRNAPPQATSQDAQLREELLQTLRREMASQKDQMLQVLKDEMRQLNSNQEAILSKSDLQYNEYVRMLVDEAKEGPRLFSFQSLEPGFLDRPKWMSTKVQLTLWCEHSRQPLPALNPPGDKRGVYELELPRKWLVKAKPFFKLVTATLSLVLPAAGEATKLILDDAAYAAIEAQLEQGQETLDAIEGSSEMLEMPEDAPEWEPRGGVMRAEGAMLRELHAILKEKDPTFGGLIRVQNKRREFIWVHEKYKHEEEYS